MRRTIAARPVARRARRATLRVVALAALALAGAAPAAAGTFRVSQCAAWNGSSWVPRTMQSDAWSSTGGYLSSSCGVAGGAITLTPPNLRLANNRSATARLAVPRTLPATSIRSFWLDWTANAQAPSVDPARAVLWGDGTLLLYEPAGWATHPGSADRFVPPSGTRALTFGFWCSPVNGPGFCNWSRPPIAIRGLTLELDESSPPAVSAAGGLLDGSVQRGRTTLTLHATDADSGVRRIEASLAGVRVASVDLTASCRDDRMPPCPHDVSRTFDVDTMPVPDGTAHLRLQVEDAAGNAADFDAGPVTVRNDAGLPRPVVVPPPPDHGEPAPPPAATSTPFPPNPLAGRGHVSNGRGATEGARILARLVGGRGHGRRLTLPARRRARITGSLAAQDGTPIGRAVLTLVSRRPGRSWHVAALVRTRADGHFTEPLRAGPSRRFAVVYHAFGDSERGRWSRRLTLRVRALVTLTSHAHRLTGGVAGPIPPHGVLVAIQRRVPGGWLVERRVMTNAEGRFTSRAASGPATIRATAPAQAGFPYAAGASRPVRLR